MLPVSPVLTGGIPGAATASFTSRRGSVAVVTRAAACTAAQVSPPPPVLPSSLARPPVLPLSPCRRQCRLNRRHPDRRCRSKSRSNRSKGGLRNQAVSQQRSLLSLWIVASIVREPIARDPSAEREPRKNVVADSRTSQGGPLPAVCQRYGNRTKPSTASKRVGWPGSCPLPMPAAKDVEGF